MGRRDARGADRPGAGAPTYPATRSCCRHGDDTLTVLEALGATDGPMPTTAGASAVAVGGLTLWVFESE